MINPKLDSLLSLNKLYSNGANVPLLPHSTPFLRLTDNVTEQDPLRGRCWASRFSTSSLLVDIMSTLLNCCPSDPGSVTAFWVRLIQLHYNTQLLSSYPTGAGASFCRPLCQQRGRCVMEVLVDGCVRPQ